MGIQGQEGHVLLVSLAQQGHINPMLRLAKLLVSKGLHVTLATTEEGRERMLKSGKTNSDSTAKLDFEFFSDGFSHDYDRLKNLNHYFDSLVTHAAKNFSELVKNLSESQKIYCIITNIFFPSAIDVAEEHGIPCALLWIQPCALYSIYYRFYKKLNPFPTLENLDVVVNLPGIPGFGIKDLPPFIHPSDPFPSFTKWLSYLIHSLDRVKWVLGSSFYELEKDAVDSMAQLHPITPIGPLVPSILLGKDEAVQGSFHLWNAQDSCLAWLDTKAPSSVIYISFGSTGVFSKKQMEHIALALKETKKPFLWVVKPSEKPSEDGAGELPVGFVEETQEQGLVVSWCSQDKVLVHPAIACFMSHCGWNSAMEAVVAGVPVIAFPLWTDQPANARLLIDVFKTGVKVRAGEDGVASKEELERCILEITEGEKAAELKEKAAEWKNEARTTLGKSGSSDLNMESFIADIVSSSSAN